MAAIISPPGPEGLEDFEHVGLIAKNDKPKFFRLFGDDGVASGLASALHWTKREKYLWFITLLMGTTMVYASRTTMPLVAPAMSKTMGWSKTEMGTVLSSFFWGYALTQIVGGYLSDRFGAEKVLLGAGIGWGLLTFWFHRIVFFHSDHDSAFNLIVFSRVVLGACQGVHFPAMASLSSRNLNARDRSYFFTAVTTGGALGTLLTGTLGSVLNETLGWPSVFYSIGALSLFWVGMLKYKAIDASRQKAQVIGITSSASLLGNSAATAAAGNTQVPWLVYLRHPSLWACVICHFCQNNCFFILLSWLPTYFHENFPEAKGWIFNVVPWLLMIPGILVANVLVRHLLAQGMSVGRARKVSESICMISEVICLVLVGQTSSFSTAVTLLALCLFTAGFHSSGAIVNPQDIAPKNTGSIFGVMNAAGAVPGHTQSFHLALFLTTMAIFSAGFHKTGTVSNTMDLGPKHSGSIFGLVNTAASVSGFVGVYIAGYILEVTGSWVSVFNVTAVINIVGISIFCLFGSGNPIL